MVSIEAGGQGSGRRVGIPRRGVCGLGVCGKRARVGVWGWCVCGRSDWGVFLVEVRLIPRYGRRVGWSVEGGNAG